MIYLYLSIYQVNALSLSMYQVNSLHIYLLYLSISRCIYIHSYLSTYLSFHEYVSIYLYISLSIINVSIFPLIFRRYISQIYFSYFFLLIFICIWLVSFIFSSLYPCIWHPYILIFLSIICLIFKQLYLKESGRMAKKVRPLVIELASLVTVLWKCNPHFRLSCLSKYPKWAGNYISMLLSELFF